MNILKLDKIFLYSTFAFEYLFAHFPKLYRNFSVCREKTYTCFLAFCRKSENFYYRLKINDILAEDPILLLKNYFLWKPNEKIQLLFYLIVRL